MAPYVSLFSILFVIVLIPVAWPWIAKHIPSPEQKIKGKLHDAELLKIIYGLKNPITPEKVKEETPLVLSEVRNRLRLLMMFGAVHPIQEANGNIKSYSKKNAIPTLEAPKDHKSMTAQELKSFLEGHLNSSDLHTGQISVLFNLKIGAAEQLLNQWAKEGFVQISYYKGFHKLYTLNNTLLASTIPAKDLVDINTSKKVAPKTVSYLANENNGILTPLLLGKSQKMSLPEAKIVLDELVALDVFRKDIDYYTGTIEYRPKTKV
ncbi:MAG: hypothetical protein GY810_26720 [Aureispira sp.]|nr:hypothetical protein [Aureispira sp.]